MRLTDETQRILAQYRRELMAQADRASVELARMLEKIERQIIRAIEREGATAVTQAQANRIVATINRIALESLEPLGGWFRAEAPKAGLNGLKTQAEFLKRIYKAESWADVPAGKVRAAFQNFEQGLGAGRVLRLSDVDLAMRWAAEWNGNLATISRSLQAEFVRGATLGMSWLDIANQVQTITGDLDIRGRVAPDVFARGFTRAKLTEIATDTSIQVARAAGITQYVNVGVPDDRQSDECAEASRQPPMTLEEWAESEWGIPPRHVFNCRCDLAGVPDDMLDEIKSGIGAKPEAELEAVDA